jgi:hypothetical protein
MAVGLTTSETDAKLDAKLVCSWMRESNIDWIIQGPACGVLIINLIFLVRIMWVSEGRLLGIHA